MKVAIYVSHTDRALPCYGLLSASSQVSLLPPGEKWTYVRSGDTAEFHLPEAVEQEIESRGFWAHNFGEGAPVSHAGVQTRKPRGYLGPR
jgi:hypothetical protein